MQPTQTPTPTPTPMTPITAAQLAARHPAEEVAYRTWIRVAEYLDLDLIDELPTPHDLAELLATDEITRPGDRALAGHLILAYPILVAPLGEPLVPPRTRVETLVRFAQRLENALYDHGSTRYAECIIDLVADLTARREAAQEALRSVGAELAAQDTPITLGRAGAYSCIAHEALLVTAPGMALELLLEGASDYHAGRTPRP